MEYAEYLDGKTVCLIGPSSGLLKMDQQKVIDSYDVVARMNFGWPVPSKVQKVTGNRCDVLYISHGTHLHRHGILSDIEKVKEASASGVEWLVTQATGGKYKAFDKYANGHIKHRHMDATARTKLKETLSGTRPNMGFYAMVDLLSFNIGELYVTGMDFYQNGYYKGYGKFRPRVYPVTKRVHRQARHIKLFKDMCKNDKRICYDDIIRGIISKEVVHPHRARPGHRKIPKGSVKLVAKTSFLYGGGLRRRGHGYYAPKDVAKEHIDKGWARRV